MPSPPPVGRISRRGVLGLGVGLGVGLAAAGVSGCTVGTGSGGDGGADGADDGGFDPPFRRERASCVARDSLDTHRTLAGAPLIYEIDDRASRFWFDTGFHAQLEQWAAALGEGWGSRPERWFTYGSWTNGGSACDSWHNAGRAFDLARVRLADGTTLSCRYDQWRDGSGAALQRSRRAYWSLAAGLHSHFAYVLTYLYDSSHANHIHVDNGRSGRGMSTFSTGSRVQVQAVQAICTYVWDEPVELSGRWDTVTRQAGDRVLERIGLSGSVSDGDEEWRAFLGASATRDPG